jgi:Domain of unknown function (DUF4189)
VERLGNFVNQWLTFIAAVAVSAVASPPSVPPQQQKLPSGAVAIHQDFEGYWLVTGEADQEVAKRSALERCRKMVVNDCEIAFAFSAKELVLGYGVDGALMGGIGYTPQQAHQQFAHSCQRKYGQLCPTDKSFSVSDKLSILSQQPERRKYAAIAGELVVGSNAKSTAQIWVAAGQPTYDDAVTKAMQPCIAELGKDKCRFFETSGPTHIVFYRDNISKSVGFRMNISESLAIADIRQECDKAGISCEIVASHAAREPVVRSYDLARLQGRPLAKVEK